MNSNTTYNAFTSLLLIVAIVLSFSTEGLYPTYGLTASDSSQQSSLCKNIDPSLSISFPSELNTGNQDAPIPQGSTTIAYSCNMSVQMIAVEKQSLFAPTESDILLTVNNDTPLPQAFVFQEPDPPRLG